MTDRKLKLVPAPLPPRTSRATSEYAEMAREFAGSDHESAKVEGNAKPSTIVSGLKKAIADLSLPIRVVTRSDEVYLIKEEASQGSLM
jgi:hypothetical protein